MTAIAASRMAAKSCLESPLLGEPLAPGRLEGKRKGGGGGPIMLAIVGLLLGAVNDWFCEEQVMVKCVFVIFYDEFEYVANLLC